MVIILFFLAIVDRRLSHVHRTFFFLHSPLLKLQGGKVRAQSVEEKISIIHTLMVYQRHLCCRVGAQKRVGAHVPMGSSLLLPLSANKISGVSISFQVSPFLLFLVVCAASCFWDFIRLCLAYYQRQCAIIQQITIPTGLIHSFIRWLLGKCFRQVGSKVKGLRC